MKKAVWFTTLAMMVGLIGLVATPANAATLQVDDNGVECPAAGFTSVKSAVGASSPGDTIEVCPGTYDEAGQITIMHDLAIVGSGVTKPVIRPTQNTGNNGNARGFILVNSDVRFDLSDVVLDGNGFKVWQAIRDLGFGTISRVDFTDIRYPTYNGTALAAFGNGNVDVFDSTFTQIGRVGVQYFGTGIDGSIYSGNTYVGKGPGDWLDYALDIGAGAKPIVRDSDISGNRGVASSDGSTSAAILVTTFFGGGTAATILDNDIEDNTTGIYQGFNASDTSTIEAHGNSIEGNDTGFRNVSTSKTADATCNWWGASNGPSGDASGSGDPVRGMVDYAPWETSENGPCNGGHPEPSSKTDCKSDGWMNRGDSQGLPFNNQGQCIQYVNTGK